MKHIRNVQTLHTPSLEILLVPWTQITLDILKIAYLSLLLPVSAYMSQSPLAPPHAHTNGDTRYHTPHPPTVGWGVGWASHALLLAFTLGLQQNTAFGSIA